jgi:hypothetical protein
MDNIQQVEGHMQLSAQAESTTTHWMADVPGYYRPVWFHPGGIANILLLINVKAKDHVTYYICGGDSPNKLGLGLGIGLATWILQALGITSEGQLLYLWVHKYSQHQISRCVWGT